MGNSKRIAVVGAGFFGLNAARFLAVNGNDVTVFEQREDAMLSASTLNQARVHAGYHYPRSLSTAARSRKNYIRFSAEFGDAIDRSFESIYAIAVDSKVSSLKFERFMNLIEAPYEKKEVQGFLNPDLIQSAYAVDESAFDANQLRIMMKEKLNGLSVQMNYSTQVSKVYSSSATDRVSLIDEANNEYLFDGVVGATYGVDTIEGFNEYKVNLIYEVCEILEVKCPSDFENKGLTIMDGPYWSLTPWPARDNYVLTNVRHTPHARFLDADQAVSYLNRPHFSRAEIMSREVAKYAPFIKELEVERNHFVVKTILAKREYDDARPIVIKRSNRTMSLLGSKIDNVYDMEESLMKFAADL